VRAGIRPDLPLQKRPGKAKDGFDCDDSVTKIPDPNSLTELAAFLRATAARQLPNQLGRGVLKIPWPSEMLN
jgi:hypothetical protein